MSIADMMEETAKAMAEADPRFQAAKGVATRLNILHEADEVTGGSRNEAYGSPAVNHQNTADAFAWYLNGKYGVDLPLDHDDTCYFNILQKISRSFCDPDHRDNWTDIAGYARNLEMIRENKNAG